jgi:hypothetical protein
MTHCPPASTAPPNFQAGHASSILVTRSRSSLLLTHEPLAARPSAIPAYTASASALLAVLTAMAARPS